MKRARTTTTTKQKNKNYPFFAATAAAAASQYPFNAFHMYRKVCCRIFYVYSFFYIYQNREKVDQIYDALKSEYLAFRVIDVNLKEL